MPIFPTSANPYSTVGDILNTARQRINDMQNDANGDLLTNEAPYTQTALSDAWRWLQDKCAEQGIEVNTDEVTLYGLPARAGDDVAQQCWVTWQGCSDGINQYDGPVIPQSLVVPVSIWRRPSIGVPIGVGYGSGFALMRQAADGLPRYIDTEQYDWRASGLYYYGESYPQDILIRGSFYLPDLIAMRPSDIVPIRGCGEALGMRVALYFTVARVPGGPGASTLQQMSEDSFASALGQRTSKRRQRMTVRRRGFNESGGGNPYLFIR